HRLKISHKGKNNPVSNADTDVEYTILNQLQRAYPDYNIMAEESKGLDNNDSPYCWIVDPIDGTTNFIRGIPHFAMTVALKKDQEIISGVIYDPIRDEMFFAEKGRGAFLNNHRIRVSQLRVQQMNQMLLATGFPHRHKEKLKPYLRSFEKLFSAVSGIRRMGSAALDLAYVADGRFDGFWEMKLAPWDIAAGTLIVKEAGGFVMDFSGEDNYLRSGNIIAATSAVREIMLKRVQEAHLE
ncbi:inositol monophosphatase family protein, partial [Magnetococcales bacterium HHB-1]